MKNVSKAISSFDNKIIEKELRKVIPKFKLQGKIIDYGCGQMPYAHLFKDSEIIGADIQIPTMKTKATIEIKNNKTKLKKNSFDIAICTEVVEHEKEPNKVLKEINRILKKNGHLILTAPFMVPEHEERDYWRYTLKGLKTLAKNNGFQVLYEKKLTKNFHSAGHLAGNAINTSLIKPGKSHKYIGAIVALPLYFITRGFMAIMNKPSSLQTGPMINMVIAKKK
ncbi:hypothetical protein CL614_05235 [archaeon]|nr:hypothetical protein [archaeon]